MEMNLLPIVLLGRPRLDVVSFPQAQVSGRSLQPRLPGFSRQRHATGCCAAHLELHRARDAAVGAAVSGMGFRGGDRRGAFARFAEHAAGAMTLAVLAALATAMGRRMAMVSSSRLNGLVARRARRIRSRLLPGNRWRAALRPHRRFIRGALLTLARCSSSVRWFVVGLRGGGWMRDIERGGCDARRRRCRAAVWKLVHGTSTPTALLGGLVAGSRCSGCDERPGTATSFDHDPHRHASPHLRSERLEHEVLLGKGIAFCVEPALRLLPGGGTARRTAMPGSREPVLQCPSLSRVACRRGAAVPSSIAIRPRGSSDSARPLRTARQRGRSARGGGWSGLFPHRTRGVRRGDQRRAW